MLKGYAPLIANVFALFAILAAASARGQPPATNAASTQPSLTVEQIERAAVDERAAVEKVFEAQLAQILQRRLDRLNHALEAALSPVGSAVICGPLFM